MRPSIARVGAVVIDAFTGALGSTDGSPPPRRRGIARYATSAAAAGTATPSFVHAERRHTGDLRTRVIGIGSAPPGGSGEGGVPVGDRGRVRSVPVSAGFA